VSIEVGEHIPAEYMMIYIGNIFIPKQFKYCGVISREETIYGILSNSLEARKTMISSTLFIRYRDKGYHCESGDGFSLF